MSLMTRFCLTAALLAIGALALWIARRSNDPVPESLEGFALRELEQPRTSVAEATAP